MPSGAIVEPNEAGAAVARHSTVAVALGLLLSARGASAQPLTLHGSLPEPDSDLMAFESGWRAKAGDDLAWADPDFDDSDWPEVSSWFERVPPELELDRVAWFRIRIDVPEDLVRRELALGLVHHGSVQVFIDGLEVLEKGRIQEAVLGGETAHSGCPRASARIRFERPGGHTMAVRFASPWISTQLRAGVAAGFVALIGSPSAFERAERETEGRMATHLWFFGGTLFLSILYFFLFSFRRDRPENLHFAVSSLALGFVALSVRGTVFANTVVQELAYVTLFRFSVVWASYSYLRFAQELLFQSRPRRTWLYLGIALVLSVGCIWFHVRYYYYYSLFLLIDCAAVLALGVLTKMPGARVVALGGFCAVAAAVIQLVPPLIGYEPFASAFVWGFAINYFVISFVLARSYARAQEDLADQMSRALEHERRAKEEALARRELEAENARQEVQLEEARKREAVLAQLEEANRELKAAQSQLVQSGKMAALGQLVAGVAHEINTPTGAIASMHQSLLRAIHLLEEDLGRNHPELLEASRPTAKSIGVLKDAANVIGSGSERVTEIVKRLRTFARLDEAEFKLADLNEGLRDTLMLVAHRKKHGVRFVEELRKLPRIACFPSQLNQVFLNLLVNAVQAIEAAEGCIRVGSRHVDGFVEVEVEDDGVGIPQQNLDRIFDPGFTTKGVRVGTGLGLSISYRIVQDHQGRIDVWSEPGRGTRFTVAIPVDLDERLELEPEA